MKENELRVKVQNLIGDLISKIELSVPDEGSFGMVYSDFSIKDRDLCLTDILLKFQAIPDHLPNHVTDRWLELVGYKLPAPIKTSRIIFKGTKKDAVRFLKRPEAEEIILSAIPQLDDNMRDV